MPWGSTDVGTTEAEPDPEAEAEPDPVSCTGTDVGIAFQSVNATVISDADAAPPELIDGCVDRDHSWSSDKGSIVTLDAGAVHQMQGVYIWSTFARMEWLKIESSADGLNWVVDWHAVPTKPVSGPVYYGLAQAGSKRYLRVTGFGSSMNSWTNIAEVRWSLSGYGVTGDKVLRDLSADNHESSAHSAHDLLPMMSRHTTAVAYIRQSCPYGVEPSFADITGTGTEFLATTSVNGRAAYLIDWDHYPRLGQDPFYHQEGALKPFSHYQSLVFDHPDFSIENHTTQCELSGRADQWYSFTPSLLSLLSGESVPNLTNWH